ncbi:MAG: glycosyltransferase [Betaproteobacteria bacterium]|nr:glycosyltransferase [Betaproteobacteria bacterium]
MAAPSLTVAIVTHAPDMHWLARTLAYLAEAAHYAREQGTLGDTRLVIVDNGPEGLDDDLARLAAAALERAPGVTFEVASGQGNVGFARANNLALERGTADLHLILNPDVEMDTNALDAGLRYLAANAGVGVVTPAARHPDGRRQYLVKAMPTWGVLFLRAFAPSFVRSWFKAKLDAYEMRERDWERGAVPGGDRERMLPAVPPRRARCREGIRCGVLPLLRGFRPDPQALEGDAHRLRAGREDRASRRPRGVEGPAAHGAFRAVRLPVLPRAPRLIPPAR